MKRTLLGVTAIISSLTCSWAQPFTDSTGVVSVTGKFKDLDKEPEFPGGLTALMQYVSKNIHYPDSAFANNVEGIVSVLFTIDKEGNTINAKVEHGIGWGCDEEAIKLISAMPAWSPGIYKEKAVEVLYRLPVHFSIPDKIPESIPAETDLVYRYVDENAEFPGGKYALIKYLSNKIPELGNKDQLQGTTLEFQVQSNGIVSSIKLLKHKLSDASLEQKLSEIIVTMPKWLPAKANGKAVNAYYDLPINDF